MCRHALLAKQQKLFDRGNLPIRSHWCLLLNGSKCEHVLHPCLKYFEKQKQRYNGLMFLFVTILLNIMVVANLTCCRPSMYLTSVK